MWDKGHGVWVGHGVWGEGHGASQGLRDNEGLGEEGRGAVCLSVWGQVLRSRERGDEAPRRGVKGRAGVGVSSRANVVETLGGHGS